MTNNAPNTDKAAQRLGRVTTLGRVLADIMASGIEPRYNNISAVETVWRKILPAELAGHCRIAALDEGLLTITVDSPAYGFQLRLAGDELLKKLRSRCPASAVRKIKIIVGR